jgi:tetratricopeptide (TPR) repeat protein
VVPLLGMRAYVDLGVALFATLALAELLRWRRTGSVPSLLASALFAGCAMGGKYTAVLVVPAALALGRFERPKGVEGLGIAAPALRRQGGVRAAALWCATALLPLLPWLAKNWFLKANPVSPLLGGVFGTHEVIPGDVTPFGEIAASSGAFLATVQAHLTALIYNHGRIDGPIAATVTGLVPLVFLRPATERLRDLRRAVLAWGGLWLVLAPDARFFLPILPAVCVVEAAALETLVVRAGMFRRTLVAILEAGLIMGAVHAAFIQWVFFAPLTLATGFDTVAAKMATGLQPAPYNGYLTAWINAHVPRQERVWFVSDFSTYFVQRECLADFHFGRSRFTQLLEEAPTADALARRLRQRGFRWICSTGALQAQYLFMPSYYAAPPAVWGQLKQFLATRTDVAFQSENYTLFRIGPPHAPRPLPDLPVVSTLAYHAADDAMDAGRYPEALRGYLVVHPLLEDVGSTWVRRGDVAMVLNDTANGLAAFRRALALGSDAPRVHAGLGNALLRLGRAAEALPHNQRSFQLNPLSPNAANTLAVNYSMLGRVEDARRYSRAALALSPDDPDYRAFAAQLGTKNP